jgi:uncharacterized delta-60 repeat protein
MTFVSIKSNNLIAMKKQLFTICLLFSWIVSFGQFSDQLDPSFGTDGSKDHFFNISLRPVKIGVRSDNKIVVLMDGTTGNAYLRVVLMNENGTGLESNFGISNSQSTFGSSFGNISEALRPSDMIIMPDNSILIGGQITNSNPTRQDLFVMKLTPNGTLDQSFGENGIISKRLNENFAVNMRAHGMTLAADGSIYIAGSPQLTNVYITHFSADGTPDLDYGVNGWATILQDNPPGSNTNCKLAELSDGRIMAVTAGIFDINADLQGDWAPGYFCFLPNGTLDPNFQNGIRVLFQQYNTSSLPPSSFTIEYDEFILGDLMIGQNDTIYITGSILDEDETSNIDHSTVLISLLPNGEYNPNIVSTSEIDTLNANFLSEVSGQVIYRLTTYEQDQGIKLLMNENQEIVLVGYGFTNEAVSFIRHLDSRGRPIESFGDNGLVIYNVFELQEIIRFYDGALQSNGELICFSPATNANNIQGFNLIRFGENGPLNMSKKPATNQFTIFPNPANRTFQINSPENIEKTNIYDLSGKLILGIENVNSISIESLQAGIYLVELEHQSTKSFHKLSVVH